MKKWALFFSLLSLNVQGQSTCDPILSELLQEESPTISFLALLKVMLEGQQLTIEKYAKLIDSIEKGRKLNFVNDLIQRPFVKMLSRYLEYWEDHPEYINRAIVLAEGKKVLQEWHQKQGERDEAAHLTISPFKKMEMARIDPGKFMMGDDNLGRREIVLGHAFEMQRFLVTQSMWGELMGMNPASFSKGDQSITMAISGKMFTLQPDHPVENVNWYSALWYANKLSEKEGLRPVYDFSGVTEFIGSPEEGTYEIIAGEIKLNGENIYATEGYRLPTKAEWEYAARAGSSGRYFFGQELASLSEHDWIVTNSSEQTHLVGEKSANPYGLYDLYGNVREWMADVEGDPLYPYDRNLGGRMVVSGGGWSSYALEISSASYHLERPYKAYPDIGFRLVRSVPTHTK